MAESPSSALPGGVQWLPAIGGAHLLRAEVGRGEPPTLVLQSARGGEHTIAPGPQTRFSRSADFLIPAGLRWSVSMLVWPDGTRAVLPEPPAGRAEVIELASRRPAPPAPAPPSLAPLPWTASPWEEPPTAAPPPPAAPSSATPMSPTPPFPVGSAPSPAAPASPAPSPAAPSSAAPSQSVPASLAPAPSPAAPGSLAPAPSPAAPGSLAPALSPAVPSSAAPSPAAPASATPTSPSPTFPVAAVSPGAPLSAAPVSSPVTPAPSPAAPASLAPALGSAETAIPASRAGGGSRQVSGTEFAAGGYVAVRAGLKADLSRAVEALSHAHDTERAADDAVKAIISGARSDLQAERAARAADLSVLGAQSQLIQLRAELDRAREEITHLRSALETERIARVAAEAALGVPVPPGELTELATQQSEAAATATRRSPEEANRLVAALDAAASSLRATIPAPGTDTPEGVRSETFAERTFATSPPDAAEPDAPREYFGQEHDPPEPAATLSTPAPGLRRALVTLAEQEPVTAGALIAGLLPAQGATLEEPLSYDLTARGYGTFAVTVGDGGTDVRRLTKRRPRKQAAFHLAGEPLVLAQLLAGERKRLGRFRPSARITGRRKRARAVLKAIPATTLSLAGAVKAGARLEPALVYAALPHAIPPEWTKGHVFTIAQEIRELSPRAWYITARDGVALSVVEHAQGAAADATVSMSRAAFDRMLRNEPPEPGDLPIIRGDREAVATLKRWTDLARDETRA